MKPAYDRCAVSSYRCALAAAALIILVLYLLPVVFGFPLWPGASGRSLAQVYDHTDDLMTFETGYRQLRVFIRSELLAGRLPLWMPYQMLGYPLIEQYEYQFLNPLEWLNWLAISDLWWTIVLIAQLTLGAAGTVVFCRSASISPLGAAVASILYCGAGFAAHFYLTSAFITAVPVIPWLLWFLSRMLDGEQSSSYFVGLTTCVTLLLLCGQPQIIVCTFYFVAVYVAGYALLKADEWPNRVALMLEWRRLALIGVAFAIALLIAAPQWGPFLKFQLSGEATGNHTVGWWFPRDGNRSIVNLFNFAFPYTLGISPYEVWTENKIVRPFPSEDTPIGFYATGVLLLCIGLQAAWRTRTSRAVAIGLLAIALTIIAHGYFGLRVWPFGSVTLARYSMPLFALYGAFLAGLGIDRLSDPRKLLRSALFIALLALTLVAYLAFHLSAVDIVAPDMIWHLVLLNGVSVLSALAMVGLALLAPRDRVAIAVFLVLVADVLWHFRYGFALEYDAMRLGPWALLCAAAAFAAWRPSWALPTIAATTAAIVGLWAAHAIFLAQQKPAQDLPEGLTNDRVVAGIKALGPNRSAALRISTMSSRYPVQFRSMQEKFSFPLTDFRGFGLDAVTPWPVYCGYRRALADLAARLIVITRPDFERMATEQPPCMEGVRMVSQKADILIYEDPAAAPRAYMEGADGVRRALTVTDVTPSEAIVKVAGSGLGRVILQDQYFPGWLAYVDDRPVPISRADDGVSRAVEINAPSTTVQFIYRPDFSRWILASLCGFGLVLLFCLLLRRTSPE